MECHIRFEDLPLTYQHAGSFLFDSAADTFGWIHCVSVKIVQTTGCTNPANDRYMRGLFATLEQRQLQMTTSGSFSTVI